MRGCLTPPIRTASQFKNCLIIHQKATSFKNPFLSLSCDEPPEKDLTSSREQLELKTMGKGNKIFIFSVADRIPILFSPWQIAYQFSIYIPVAKRGLDFTSRNDTVDQSQFINGIYCKKISNGVDCFLFRSHALP
jgi:hypothetical protein